ncbi:D-amino-acid transaminase [Paenibacillus sp. TRM 82003]|nr:D-amino-acid transaminase [Paenibacillus sp. TRM 82003]
MILVNDRLVEPDHASVSFQDRGYQFGDGVYEVVRLYDGKWFEKEAHFARLARSASEIGLRLPYDLPRLEELLNRLVGANEVKTGSVYVQITRGAYPRQFPFPPEDVTPVVVAFTTNAERPTAKMQSGISAVTVPDIRWLRCDIKSLSLLGAVLAKQQATERGAEEAIMHRDGVVTECSSSNFMIVKNGLLRTHPADNLILHGVTRAVVLQLAAELGIEVDERPFTLDELSSVDEAFVTSTTVEIMPVTTIDGRAVGDRRPGPITKKLQQAFESKI